MLIKVQQFKENDMESRRIKMYKAGKKWVFSLLGVTMITSLGSLLVSDSTVGYPTAHAEVINTDSINTAPENILEDTKNIPNIQDISQNNPLGVSSIFSIFSQNASLGADVNGNIATANLSNSDRDFGTRTNNFNNTSNDISYIQNIDSKKVLNDQAFRANQSVAIFGASIQLKQNDANQIEVNNRRVSTLTKDNTYQDKGSNKYIDFDQYFNDLSTKSTMYMNAAESADVQKNFQDMNNQSIDISNVDQSQKFIYVNIDFSKLSGPQDITIKGLSSKINGPSVIFNVQNTPEDGYLQTKINYIYDNGIEISSNSENHTMPNHVLWNFGDNSSTINITSGRILGSVLAPKSTINVGVNVDGNIVGSTVNVKGGETHRWDLQTPSSETPSSETPSSETPSSETPSSETPSSETPSSETPSSETPSSETPSSETPSSETPSSETPSSETPSSETPSSETPSSETPSSETPSSETPSSETPSSETPSSETPSSETPSSETPSSETPSSETPSSETPSSETPSSETPSSETPSSETPSSETPSSEIPSSETPSSETPSSETPSSETPSSETPSSETPSSETPSSETPSSETPSSETPSSETPSSETPSSETPSSETPSSETPSSETPSSETPSSETPSSETPSSETPSSETPSSETPSSETPSSETPSSETPSSETPSSETPSSETPSSETPSSETPSSETPSSETPKYNHNKKDDHQLPKTDADKGNASEAVALTALATLGISGIAVSRRKK